jgi:hypothetical protein
MNLLKSGSMAMLFASSLFAASESSIGVATTLGTISINQAVVSGTNDLSDGSHLATTSVPTEVRLASGADVRLATRSAGSFFSDHVSLDQGALRVGSFNGLTVDAAQLEITSDEAGSQAVVRMNQKSIEVASIGGAVNVMDGGILTRVAAGTKMSFQQSGASPTGQANPATTGATPAPAPGQKKMPGDVKTIVWVIGITAVAALAVGLTAAAQGKSPFH